jgi:serine/threonine-protein kinase
MDILKALLSKAFILNFLAGMLILALIVFGLNSYLHTTTNHDESFEVPDLNGIVLDQVPNYLENGNLRYTVIDSSAFSKRFKSRAVLRQDPPPGAKVKHGRMIYLTINPSAYKKVALPKLIDRPHREAVAALKSAGFNLGQLKFQYGKYKAENIVLAIQYNGANVEEGAKLPKMSSIDLVIDYGATNTSIVPNLIGDSFQVASGKILNLSLNVGAVYYDDNDKKNRNNFFVYKQSPEFESDKKISKGRKITLWLTEDESKLPIIEDEALTAGGETQEGEQQNDLVD